MRIFLLLLLTLGLAVLLAFFPGVAGERLRVEAFGWIFETTQGVFIVSLILLLALAWALRRLLAALFAGPGQVWQTLRTGSRRRREARLREGVARLIDMRHDLGAKSFRKARGVLPKWAAGLLRTLATPADAQPLAADEDELRVALAARIATDPDAHPRPDLATRKAHLEAWLAVHPAAPLAQVRLADVAEEEEEWHTLVRLLEEGWKRGLISAASAKPRLARAYLALANAHPAEALSHLRKAHRLLPDDGDVVMALGRAYVESAERRAAQRLWLAHLESHDDEAVARALFELLEPEALKAYRKLEQADRLNGAARWLRAQLAHAAELDGLAEEHMRALLDENPTPLAWRTWGDWHADAGDCERASHCYREALKLRGG